MGAWIETNDFSSLDGYKRSRTLYGCVDWNLSNAHLVYKVGIVAPYMGAWIETL